MSDETMRFPRVLGAGTIAAQNVLLVCHKFKVERIRAGS